MLSKDFTMFVGASIAVDMQRYDLLWDIVVAWLMLPLSKWIQLSSPEGDAMSKATRQQSKTRWISSRRSEGAGNRLGLAVGGFCVLLAWALPATASPIVVGNPPDAGVDNCFPFGCAYEGEYQQVYSSSLFSGPITITDLEFYNTQFNSGATTMN